ncbi:hypothetical protein [Flexistipes sp.]|uniref:hypothetical protein n=1 Tax=Flexistipes sp. TaxID=3088135 RepID=UPI002E20E333|nr:hypothetical protein [Flexistipes sp.]
MSEKVRDQLSDFRRSFMKWTATLGAVATTGCGVFEDDSNSSSTKDSDGRSLFSYDRLVWNSCNVNCGSRCPLRLYVRDGQVVRVNTDNESPDEYGKLGKNYQMRSCFRGRTVRQRIYNPTRFKNPMKKKAGTLRGEGKYERISF